MLLVVGPCNKEYGGNNGGGVSSHVSDLVNEFSNRNGNNSIELLATGQNNRKTNKFSSVLVHSYNYKMFNVFIIMKALYVAFTSLRYGNVRYFFNTFITGLKIFSIPNKQKYTVVHVHSFHHGAMHYMNLFNNAKIILTVHSYHSLDNDSSSSAMRRLISDSIALSDDIIHVSFADKNKSLEYGFNIEHSKVVYNGVKFISDLNIPSEKYGFCFVGTDIPRKRLSLLLDTFSKNLVVQKKLVLAGNCNRSFEELDSKVDIQSLGYLDRDELYALYRNSIALVVPSTSESFGLVYIEALSCGTGVIGYAPTINEFSYYLKLDKYEKKLLFAFDGGEDDTKLLASYMNELYYFINTPLGRSTAYRLALKVKDYFGWNKVIKDLEHIYFEGK